MTQPYDDKTASELRTELASRKLDQAGNKQELASRLREHDANQSPSVPPADQSGQQGQPVQPADRSTGNETTPDGEIVAAGGDPDSRLRLLKTQLAAAEAAGDEDRIRTAREGIEQVGRDREELERQVAARRRGEHADPNAVPQGRTSTASRQVTTDSPPPGA